MFYQFEDEGEKKVFYECDIWALLSEEDLNSIASVTAVHISRQEDEPESYDNLLEKLSELSRRSAYSDNITKLKIWESDFTAGIIQKLAECFPFVKTFELINCKFSAGAIESIEFFSNLRTLKLHNYFPENCYYLQEFGNLKQLKSLIIESTSPHAYNFSSLSFLRKMNLDKLEIEDVLSVYTPVINGTFNTNILNNKKLQQKEEKFKKLLECAVPGNKSALAAAEGFFEQGMIDKGIEYLYLYGSTGNPAQQPPFVIAKSQANRDILLFQWLDRDWLTPEYFDKRPFLSCLYPETEIPLSRFYNTAFECKYNINSKHRKKQ